MIWKKYLSLSLIIGLPFFSCNKENLETELQNNLTKQITSQHYHYFMRTNDFVDTVFQEKYIDWLQEELNLALKAPITYFRFRNRPHLEEITGRSVNAYAESDQNRIFTIWGTDTHESVHILMEQHRLRAPYFFNEGISVAHSGNFEQDIFIPHWGGADFHLLTQTFLHDEQLPSLDQCLNDFRKIDSNLSYPIAGSFVRFLIDRHGIEKVKSFHLQIDFKAKHMEIEEVFETIFDSSLIDFWQTWLQFIEQY